MNSGKYALTCPVALKRASSCLLDQLPDGVAVRADDHAALDRRVVGQLRRRTTSRYQREKSSDWGVISVTNASFLACSVFAVCRHRLSILRASRRQDRSLRLRRRVDHVTSSSVDRRARESRRGSAPPRLSSRRSAARAMSRPTVERGWPRASASASQRPPSRRRSSIAAPRRLEALPAPLRGRRASRNRPTSRHISVADVARRAGRSRPATASASAAGARSSSADAARPVAASGCHRRGRRGRRTRALRAASCWPAGWRRGRRCRRPRRRRTGPASTSGRRGRSRRRPSRSAPPGRPECGSRARSSPARAAGLGDRRETARARSRDRDAASDRYTGRPVRCGLAHDRARHDVARREIARRLVARHERLAVGVHQPRALAAQRLRQQEPRRARHVAAPSDETARTRDRPTRAPARYAIATPSPVATAGLVVSLIDLPGAAGREQHRARARPSRTLAVASQKPHADAARRPRRSSSTTRA